MANDVIALLTEDHREVQQLVDEALSSPPDQAREIVDRLIGQLVRHSVAEETVVYPVMAEVLPDGRQAVEHDTDEHKQLERLMKDLEDPDLEETRRRSLLGELKQTLADHVSEEEGEQFPQLKERCSPQQLESMAGQVEALKKVAPTRPHPSAPNNPLFHAIVGPGVGLVDRLRDALAGKDRG